MTKDSVSLRHKPEVNKVRSKLVIQKRKRTGRLANKNTPRIAKMIISDAQKIETSSNLDQTYGQAFSEERVFPSILRDMALASARNGTLCNADDCMCLEADPQLKKSQQEVFDMPVQTHQIIKTSPLIELQTSILPFERLGRVSFKPDLNKYAVHYGFGQVSHIESNRVLTNKSDNSRDHNLVLQSEERDTSRQPNSLFVEAMDFEDLGVSSICYSTAPNSIISPETIASSSFLNLWKGPKLGAMVFNSVVDNHNKSFDEKSHLPALIWFVDDITGNEKSPGRHSAIDLRLHAFDSRYISDLRFPRFPP